MAKRVIWTAKAKVSRRTILAFFDKEYAKRLSAEINSIVGCISKFELIGKASDYKTIRVFAFKNYSIYYQVESDQILVVGILDNRRNLDKAAGNIDL